MFPPITICSGIFRSGSTWAYNVCREFAELQAKREGKDVLCGFQDIATVDALLESGDARLSGTVVIKSHGLGPVAVR